MIVPNAQTPRVTSLERSDSLFSLGWQKQQLRNTETESSEALPVTSIYDTYKKESVSQSWTAANMRNVKCSKYTFSHRDSAKGKSSTRLHPPGKSCPLVVIDIVWVYMLALSSYTIYYRFKLVVTHPQNHFWRRGLFPSLPAFSKNSYFL